MDTTTRKLQIVLGGAHATTAPKTAVFYYDVPKQTKQDSSEYPRVLQVATSNGATDVDICDAVGVNGTRRHIESIVVHNLDTASITLTIKVDDSGTETILVRATLLTLESLHYEDGQGWYALDANANRKEVTASTFSSITVTGLTATRVPFAGTGGLLGDDSGFTFNTTGDILTAGAYTTPGAVTAFNGTGIPAGGTAGSGFKLSSTTNYGVFFGSGAPTLSAAKGSLYLRSDGTGTGDRAYINTDGGTTWTALTTAA